MQEARHGIVEHPDSSRPTDYLFRISIKCLVRNDAGEVLVVKETGRDWWDLPGGGIDHGESIRDGIARELAEEVSLRGNFSYRILTAEDPKLLKHGFYQIRLVVALAPEDLSFQPGPDADEVKFISPSVLQFSEKSAERQVYVLSRLESTQF